MVHPRYEVVLSGVKASKARLMSEAEARRKKKSQKLARKKIPAVVENKSGTELETAAQVFRIDYEAAAKDALNRRT